MSSSQSQPAGTETPVIHLARWTVTSGSNSQSRGAVVLTAGDHQWEATAEGNGPIDALYRAVDRAIADVLTGHPRLIEYDIHALAEGPDADGAVRVRIAPPKDAGGARGTGQYTGAARSTNILAASVEAYLEALNLMLAEEHWAGAAESAGDRRRGRRAASQARHRAELDEEAGRIDTTEWFNR